MRLLQISSKRISAQSWVFRKTIQATRRAEVVVMTLVLICVNSICFIHLHSTDGISSKWRIIALISGGIESNQEY